ncbi:hypothetical protein ABZ471_41355 [Streptomyces sp. NPDC005728]|uniref:hypothetical protein n=1 Tax=Streptomyces sp. NPDC005728 TaxID=3157054 RepID=UPI0034102472
MGLLLGAPATRGPGSADVGLLPAASALLQAKSAGDEDRLTLDRLDQDGGELMHVGSTFHVHAGFTYHGEQALRQVRVSVTLSEGLSFTTEYSNCEYGTAVHRPEIKTFHTVLCLIDMRVEPGESLDLAPIALKVGESALWEHVDVADATSMAWSGAKWQDRHRGRGKKLTLVKRTGGVPPAARKTEGMSNGRVDVPVDNAWDLEVTGAAVKGKKGDTVTADLALDFHGADVEAQRSVENDDPFANVEVRLPEGVTVVSAPKDCWRSTKEPTPYLCGYGLKTNGFDVPVLRDGFHKAFPFKLRIDNPSKLTRGRIRMDAPAKRLRDDADPSNSTAPITIEAVGGSGGSGRTAWGVAAGAGALALTGLLTVALVRACRRTR